MPDWFLHPETKVVNIKSGARYDLYVGRSMPTLGLAWNKWGNPFRIGPDGSRSDVVKRFEQYLVARPGLFAQVAVELRGRTLACWCEPLNCHGRVLARIADAICINCRMHRGKYDPHTGNHVCSACQAECNRQIEMAMVEKEVTAPP